MPIYVYRCQKGHTRELVRRISQMDDPVTCEPCTEVLLQEMTDEEVQETVSTAQMERVEVNRLARPKFNGSGFYETDYVNPKAPWRSVGDEPPENVEDYTEID